MVACSLAPQHHWYHTVWPWRVDHKTSMFTSQTMADNCRRQSEHWIKSEKRVCYSSLQNGATKWDFLFSLFSRRFALCINADNREGWHASKVMMPRPALCDDYNVLHELCSSAPADGRHTLPWFHQVARSYGCFWFSTCLQGSGALQFPGGVPTSLRKSGQQWDHPNAWPPLQHMLIDGRWQSVHVSVWEFPASWSPYWLLIDQFHGLFCVSAQQCVKMHCGRPCFNALFWLCTRAHGQLIFTYNSRVLKSTLTISDFFFFF